jgi:hypothetical protein
LEAGIAYLTLYSSTPARHRRTLRAIATEAHEQQRGVWATNETANCELIDHDSIGSPDGVLVLPKLFRRCTDYLKARDAGFQGLLPDWLVAASATGRRPASDLLLIGGRTEVGAQRRRATPQRPHPLHRPPPRHRLRLRRETAPEGRIHNEPAAHYADP